MLITAFFDGKLIGISSLMLKWKINENHYGKKRIPWQKYQEIQKALFRVPKKSKLTQIRQKKVSGKVFFVSRREKFTNESSSFRCVFFVKRFSRICFYYNFLTSFVVVVVVVADAVELLCCCQKYFPSLTGWAQGGVTSSQFCFHHSCLSSQTSF